MNSSAAGDIDDPQVFEEAVVTPDPAGRHTVDDGVDEREEAICIKVTSENRYNKVVDNQINTQNNLSRLAVKSNIMTTKIERRKGKTPFIIKPRRSKSNQDRYFP